MSSKDWRQRFEQKQWEKCFECCDFEDLLDDIEKERRNAQVEAYEKVQKFCAERKDDNFYSIDNAGLFAFSEAEKLKKLKNEQ